jgi:putative DNA methylase
MATIKTPKKLIEVALPLNEINALAADEKSNPFLKGHPRNLHQWWARRPLAAARAIIFAQMVNDPGYERNLGRGINKEKAKTERERLFSILIRLASWDNSSDTELMRAAFHEIKKSWQETYDLNKSNSDFTERYDRDSVPIFQDPFAGGGGIPLEAQRLGLRSFATDLNPVAVTINKALLEIPSKFRDLEPVGPIEHSDTQALDWNDWNGPKGLAEDVRRYGKWVRDRALRDLRQIYPKIRITRDMASKKPDLLQYVDQFLEPIAWIWTRTVRSPSAGFSHVHVPIASTFVLSSKAGKEVYVEPTVENGNLRFELRTGEIPDRAKFGTKLGRGANFECLLSKAPISGDYVKEEGRAGRIGYRLMAIVCEGRRSKVFVEPSEDLESAALSLHATWKPENPLPEKALGFSAQLYFRQGVFGDLFMPRQLHSMATISQFISEAGEDVHQRAIERWGDDDQRSLEEDGRGARAYADAVRVYLALALDKLVDYNNSACTWNPTNQNIGHLFTKQAIPMAWDFPESSPLFGGLSFDAVVEGISRTVEQLPASAPGSAFQHDCATPINLGSEPVVSTDPPYYDNIGYADLADFFYPWLRRSLRTSLPSLFSTISTPKSSELVADPNRHGGRAEAERFFLNGMTSAMHRLSVQSHPSYPITIYYAFKQSDTDSEGSTASTGWETFLDAVLNAGLAITGTWPVRTERDTRSRGQGSNALASSIVLVCRRRDDKAPTISRREFIRELNSALPVALDEMTRGGVNSPVAPVDLSQAIIGPGMAIFSQYAAVLEADGTPMRVKAALQLINRFLAEDDFDHDTQFCLHWFEEQGWATGRFGEADVLARAKGTSVAGLQATGVVESGKGDLRLLRWSELPRDWSPETDSRLSVWEALHHLIRALNQDGESAAGALLACMPARAESIRALAYRLYTLCERKGWTDDARAYNELVTAWSAIEQTAGEAGVVGTQTRLDI